MEAPCTGLLFGGTACFAWVWLIAYRAGPGSCDVGVVTCSDCFVLCILPSARHGMSSSSLSLLPPVKRQKSQVSHKFAPSILAPYLTVYTIVAHIVENMEAKDSRLSDSVSEEQMMYNGSRDVGIQVGVEVKNIRVEAIEKTKEIGTQIITSSVEKEVQVDTQTPAMEKREQRIEERRRELCKQGRFQRQKSARERNYVNREVLKLKRKVRTWELDEESRERERKRVQKEVRIARDLADVRRKVRTEENEQERVSKELADVSDRD